MNSLFERLMGSPRNRRATAAAMCVLIVAATISPAWSTETIIPGEKLTLQRAIELTLQNHPRGLEMQFEAAAARARIGEARSALMPQVYSAGEYIRSTDNPIGNTTYLNPGFIPRITGTLHGGSPDAGQSFSSTNNFLTGVGGEQYLFDFGRVHGLIQERTQEAHAAQAQVQQTDLDLIFEVTQRYFALLAAGQKTKGLRKSRRAAHRATARRQSQGGGKPHSSNRCAYSAGDSSPRTNKPSGRLQRRSDSQGCTRQYNGGES